MGILEFIRGWQRYVLFVLPFVVALLPIVFIPASDLDPEITKSVIVAFVAGAAIIYFGVCVLIYRIRELVVPSGFIFLAPFLLALVASDAVSGFSMSAWWGIMFDTGTVGFYCLFLIVAYCSARLSLEHVVRMLKLFSGATVVAAVGAAVTFFLFEGSGLFSSLVGEWPQISFLLGAAIFSYLIAQSLQSGSGKRGVFLGFFVIAVVGLFIFPYIPAYMALGFALTFLAVRARIFKENGHASVVRTSVLLIIILVAFLLLARNFGISEKLPTEVHPTFLLTELVAIPALTGNVSSFVFGVGPMEFGTAWLRHYPIEINQTSFWNNQFTSGQSFFLTRVVEIGLLGLIGIVVMMSIVIRFFNKNQIIVAAVAFFLVSGFSYAIEAPMILWGACVMGLLLRDTGPGVIQLHPRSAPFLGMIIIIFGSIVFGVAMTQLTSALYHQRGLNLYQSGDKVAAAIDFEQASERWGASPYLQDSARVMLELGLSSPEINPEQQQELLGRSIGRIDEAIQYSPQDFNSWLIRASLYVSFVAAGDSAAETEARASIAQAKSISPNRPDPYYVEAMLERNLQNTSAARAALRVALTLKPDYLEAHQLMEAL